jgi:hypothetical protein
MIGNPIEENEIALHIERNEMANRWNEMKWQTDGTK